MGDCSSDPSLLRFACPEDTRRMPARAEGNYCSTCRKVVHNLSELEPDAAAELVRAGRPGTCVSYSVLEDGRVAFRRQGGRVALSLVTFLAACAGPAPEVTETPPIPPSPPVEVEPMPETTLDAPAFHPVEPTVSLKAPASRPPRDKWPSATADTNDPQKSAPPPVVRRPLAGKPAPPPRPEPVRGEMRVPSPPSPPHPAAGGLRVPDRRD